MGLSIHLLATRLRCAQVTRIPDVTCSQSTLMAAGCVVHDLHGSRESQPCVTHYVCEWAPYVMHDALLRFAGVTDDAR